MTLFHATHNSKKGERSVAPEQLIALLDKVKSYSLLAAQHPEAVEGVLHATPKQVFDYENYRLMIADVYRFEEADTLIFSITLENKTDHKITYNPQNVSIGLKENLYSTSIVDASGDIPPHATVVAYFGITGTATGGRNNLKPMNDWNIILLTKDGGELSTAAKDKNFLKASESLNCSIKNPIRTSH